MTYPSGHVPALVYWSVLQAILAPSAQRFQHGLASPERAQATRLAAVLRTVSGSRQATRIQSFARLRTAREFQDAVPLATYDTLRSDIADLTRGVPQALTQEPVLRFEKSGGSSGASKYIPQTHQLLREFHRALAPWLCNVLRQRPATRRGPGYWSISPIGQKREITPGGIAVGTVDDTSYFPRVLQGLLAHVVAVPGTLGLLPDVESCRYVTLRCLLACSHLVMISVWHPSFLTLLMQELDTHAERLLDDLEHGGCHPPARPGDNASAEQQRQRAIAHVLRCVPLPAAPEQAHVLRAVLKADGFLPAHVLWPHLCLLSMWTDAQAQHFIPPVVHRFAGVEIQGKGLLATEGVVSVPLFEAPAPVLAIRSHFYEFIDIECPEARPRLAHELETGYTYEVVISTGGGLLRYRLGDLVRVEGTVHRTPCLTFLGRADAVSDLVGEKLSSRRVSTVLVTACNRIVMGKRLLFAMLAPAWTAPPAYHLYVESDASDATLHALARLVDELFCAGHPYHYARQLGQLGAVQAIRVEDAARRYEARCVALGQRAGDVKPVDLHCDTGWDQVFAGRLLAHEGASA